MGPERQQYSPAYPRSHRRLGYCALDPVAQFVATGQWAAVGGVPFDKPEWSLCRALGPRYTESHEAAETPHASGAQSSSG